MTNSSSEQSRGSGCQPVQNMPDTGEQLVPRNAVILLICASLLLLLIGCSPLGAISYKIFGPPSTPAMYKPAKVPTLILVENFDHPAASAPDSEMLQQLLFEEFRDRKIAPVIAPDELLRLKSMFGEVEFRKLSITAVGRGVGAKQIIYVDLAQAQVESAVGSDVVRGHGTVRVRVIDVASGETLWPPEAQQGYPVSYETPMPEKEQRGNVTLARAKLHQGLALRVGRLFRKWKPDENGLTYEE
jgi:hypothetical protein